MFYFRFCAIVFIFTFFISDGICIPKIYEGVDIRSGKETKLSLGSSSYVVAYFLNGQCPCSQSHFDHLNELQKKI